MESAVLLTFEMTGVVADVVVVVVKDFELNWGFRKTLAVFVIDEFDFRTVVVVL